MIPLAYFTILKSILKNVIFDRLHTFYQQLNNETKIFLSYPQFCFKQFDFYEK